MQTNEEPSVPPPEEPQNRIRGVGETLRAARESARVSLEQAGEELRIEPKFLAALEQERYDAIGIPVFAKGYLKLYCDYLGLDFRRLLPLYEEKAGKQAPPLKGRHSIERRESSSSGLWIAVGLAVIVLVLLLIWLLRDGGLGGIGTAAVGTGRNAPAVVAERNAPAVAAGTNAPAVAAGTNAAAGANAPTGETNALASAGSATDAASAAGPGAPAATAAAASETSTIGPRASGTADEPAASEAAAASTASGAAAARLDVDMKFVQDSWVEVKDSSDARLYYGLGKAGEESHLVGVPPLAVLIGNADGVVLEVGGRPYAYPRRPRGKVASFTLTGPSE